MINVIGQCGPVLGTRLYPKHEGPQYTKGMSICAAFMFFAAIISLALRFVLAWENRRLERKYGSLPAAEKNENGARPGDGTVNKGVVGEENYGPGFRYVL